MWLCSPSAPPLLQALGLVPFSQNSIPKLQSDLMGKKPSLLQGASDSDSD